MNEIVQVISTVGFPIVAVIGMGYFFFVVWKTQETRNTEREDKLMELIRELSTNLANIGRIVEENTKELAVLSEKVEQIEHKIGE